MTHTLHRVGTRESLSRDYVFLCMPSKDINHEGSGPKIRRFLEIALEQGAIKIGDARKGNEALQGGVENVLKNVEDRAVVQAVFTDKEKVINMMKALKEANLGMSVVVSGLADEVHDCCRKAGLPRHTVEFSLGRWGRTDKLPPDEILQLNTMCGHGMVTVGLIEEMIAAVKRGALTPEEAAEELFRPCMCGAFNPARAAEIIRDIVGGEKAE